MALGAAVRHPRGVRLCGARSLVSIFLVVGAVAAVLVLSSAQASGARHDQTPCMWGASSVSAELVDGQDVVSPAATSGCTSR